MGQNENRSIGITRDFPVRIGFHTLGCKLNQYETEALASSFRGQGHVVVGSEEDAEAYIINTCTVTGRADHKSRAVVRSLSRKHPASLLIVTGCSAQLEAQALSSLGENILIVPQSSKGELLPWRRGLPRLPTYGRALRSFAKDRPRPPATPSLSG